jgi:hypothetical protein
MEQTKENFKDKLQYGKDGEKIIAEYFLNKGYSILPLYQFSEDIAPKIFLSNEVITSPDLTIFKNQKCVFIEVKRKKKWVKFGNIIETGCDNRLYCQYKKISQATGIDLFLVFIHEDIEPCGNYYININNIGRYWNGIVKNKNVSPPMYFWNLDQLNKLK